MLVAGLAAGSMALGHAAVASGAGNATVSYSAITRTITVTASAAADGFQLSRSGTVFTADSTPSSSATDFTDGAGCVEAADAKDVTCNVSPVVRVTVVAGPGNDRVAVSGTLGVPLSVEGGPGDDTVDAEDMASAVTASGDDGDDVFITGPAGDHLEGGAGDDVFFGGLGADDFAGGPGADDFVSYADSVHTMDVFIDLDGQRDDGAAGENDLITGVEGLRGGSGDDVIVGDDAPNTLAGSGGADRIDGRGGFDRIQGDDGNDTLLARDGLAERADCAEGVDVAVTDAIDGPSECETVEAIPDLQPDRDGDGVDRPLDCDDLDATTRPGAFDRPGDGVDQDCDGADDVDLDRDRDGFLAGFDCDDGNAAIHPGAREKLGNKVDEDCDELADPYAAFPTTVLLSARITGVTELVGLVLVDLDGRERVRITCKGKGCERKTRRARAGKRAESLILDRLVRGQRLRPGAKLAVRITRRDGVRKTVSFTARSGRSPKQRTRCAAPAGGRVARC